MKILYVHENKGNGLEFYKSLCKYSDVELLKYKKLSLIKAFVNKILIKLRIYWDFSGLNKQLLSYDYNKIDCVIVVKGNELYPWVLRQIKKKGVKLVNWSLDNMFKLHNRSMFYSFCLRYYDIVYTTKRSNVLELQSLGAKKVLFFWQAYSKHVHLNRNVERKNFLYDVVFVGYPEKQRINSLIKLANCGIKVHVFGYPNVWKKYCINNPYIYISGHHLSPVEYSTVLSNSKISICFLRKINDDLHTSRSIEIPACGCFMIAEDTLDHRELFMNNDSAVLFDNDDVLISKVIYYLNNQKERESIARRGFSFIQNGSYSYDDMALNLLNDIVNEKN